MSEHPVVRIIGLSKYYGPAKGIPALANISLDVLPDEILVLLGPSGCGKTTLLRSVAGLEKPNSGEIRLDGRVVYSSQKNLIVPPEQRGIGMVFQSYALWPHMTVFDNVAFPLKTGSLFGREEIVRRVETALQKVGCAQYADRYPNQLSGGQQQRVAVARAIARDMKLVLFDEPLSNVDAKVREELRVELVTMQKKLGFSAIYVTHDQVEAMVVGSRIAVMQSGGIEQIGTPQDIYYEPKSRHVADFVGASNFVRGTVAAVDGGMVVVDTAFGPLRAPLPPAAPTLGKTVTLQFRPEHCEMHPFASSQPLGANQVCGTLERSLFLGPYFENMLSVHGEVLLTWSTLPPVAGEGGQIVATVKPENIRIFSDE